MSKQYIITKNRTNGRTSFSPPMTIAEALEYYSYTLECGVSWQHEKGNKKINRYPKTIKSLITNLNNASDNTARNGCGDYYTAEAV